MLFLLHLISVLHGLDLGQYSPQQIKEFHGCPTRAGHLFKME